MPKAGEQPSTLAPSKSPPQTPQDLPRPSRRRLFSDLTRAALGGALGGVTPQRVSSASHPDAALLDVLARFKQLEEILYPESGTGCRTIREEEEREARLAPLYAERVALAEHACALRATTPDGWRARAATLILGREELDALDAADTCLGDRLLYALIRDLVQETRA